MNVRILVYEVQMRKESIHETTYFDTRKIFDDDFRSLDKCKTLTGRGECDWTCIAAPQNEAKLDMRRGVPEGDVVRCRVCYELLVLRESNS